MNPNKNYIGAGLIAAALFIACGWVWPAYNKLSDLNMAVQERQDRYDSRSATIKKIGELNKEYQSRSADIAKISAILPSKKSLAEALSSLDKIASQSGLQLVSTALTGKPTDDKEAIYNSMPIDIELNGSYPALINFLKSLEQNLRIIDVISIAAASNSSENYTLLSFNIRADAYYLK